MCVKEFWVASNIIFGVGMLMIPLSSLAHDDDVENGPDGTSTSLFSTALFSTSQSTIVTNQAMGARCAVSADFDGDGRLGKNNIHATFIF